MNLSSVNARPRLLALDLTSMVDLVFLLIIFFLTTSTFIEQGKARIDLPEEVGENLDSPGPSGIIINITRNGTFIVSGQYLTLADLSARVASDITKAGGDTAQLDLVIRCDRDAPLVHMNALATRLIDLNVRHWKLATVVPRGSNAAHGERGEEGGA